MKSFALSAVLGFFATAAFAQGNLKSGGFSPSGAFQIQVSGGPVQLEVSTNLTSWTALTNAQGTFADAAATNQEWRFYRAKAGTNIVGYVRVPVPAGKIAMVANPFDGPALALAQPTVTSNIFGTTTPLVQVYLYKNGRMNTHTFDDLTGTWDPRVGEIPAGAGFGVRNNGKGVLNVTFTGNVRQGYLKQPVPMDDSLVGALVPKPGPVQQALGAGPVDGAKIQVYDEARQQFQTTMFDRLTDRWDPPLVYKPGRAMLVQWPQPTFQTNFRVSP